MLHGAARGGLRRDLCRERRALPRALEALAAGAAPGEHVALGVRQRYHSVIERGLDMRLADRDVLFFSTPGTDDFLLGHALPLLRSLLAYPDGLARATPGARVRPGALAPHGEPTTVAQATVSAGLHQPLDVQGNFSPQLAFDLGVIVDVVARAADLLIVQVLDSEIRIDIGDGEHALRG